MAAPAKQGKDSPEYNAVKQKVNQIAKLCQYSLPVLATELLANGLLTDLEHSAAGNANHSAFERTVQVITIVRNLIERNTSYFHQFIDALKESDLTQAASDLEGSLAAASSAQVSPHSAAAVQSGKWNVYVAQTFTAKVRKFN